MASYRRFYSKESKLYFVNYLKNDYLSLVYNNGNENIDSQWNIFMRDFINIFNYSFPLKLSNKNKSTRQIEPEGTRLQK